MPTLGPMPCQGCGLLVWYDHGIFVDRGGRRGWKHHSCQSAGGRPAQEKRWQGHVRQTLEEKRTYHREWMRRFRKEARDESAEARR